MTCWGGGGDNSRKQPVGEGKKELAVPLAFLRLSGWQGVGQYMARQLFGCLLTVQQWCGWKTRAGRVFTTLNLRRI